MTFEIGEGSRSFSADIVYCAALNGAVKCMRRLLSIGFKADSYSANGFTPLHVAIVNNQPQMVLFLLAEAKVVPNCPSRHKPGIEFTPLYYALNSSNALELCAVLLEHGADPNLACLGDGMPPLSYISVNDLDEKLAVFLLPQNR